MQSEDLKFEPHYYEVPQYCPATLQIFQLIPTEESLD